MGGFRQKPNLDGLIYFVNRIFPLIRQVCLSMELMVIGSPVPRIAKTVNLQRVHLLEYVESLAPYFQTPRLSVAPLRFESGLKRF